MKISRILSVILAILIAFVFYCITIKYDVTIVGRVDYNDSMPRQTINAAQLLDKHLKINAIKIRSGKYKNLDLKTRAIFFRGNQLGRVVLFEDTITVKTTEDQIYKKLINGQLFKVFKKEEQIWIAYSMFESTKIPDIWVSTINRYFDMVVVPDPYYIDVYKSSGVKVPIFFVPLGVDLDQILSLPIKNQKNGKFTYMNLSIGRNSKNQLSLLKAFERVQKIKENVYLVINSRHSVGNTKDEIINYIKNNNIKNVEYTIGILSPEEYIAKIQRADCFIYPSKGEGFSIQPREAMALGVPTILTNNTAQKTICDSNLVECINSNIERAAYYDIWNEVVMGNNFDFVIDDLVNAMLKIYDNYEDYLKKSVGMRNWAAQYQYDNLKDLYINMVKPKKVIFGQKNVITKDYLETNSKELYEKFSKIHSN